jgi:ABC-type nitrate/sulfonate/bicarbonate transport system substrate-binding protein
MNFLHLGALGLSSVSLDVAHRHGFFGRNGADVRLVPVTGTKIPELSTEYPMGLIGAPAVLLNVLAGRQIKILASFNSGRLLNRLVVRPGIETPNDLRGGRLGARVKGAALWLHTVLALEQLGLDVNRDGINILPIGDPIQVMKALEDGRIDGAVLSATQARQMMGGGFSVLLDMSLFDLYGAPDALVAIPEFIQSQPEKVLAVIAGLAEATAFVLSKDGRSAAMESVKKVLGVTDDDVAAEGIRELAQVLERKPYPSAKRLRDMQRLMVLADPAAAKIDISDLIDERFVQQLDESNFIDGIDR